jgi:hypothetical protein
MAIGLPTSSLALNPQEFRRGKAIKSGEAAADLTTGTLREITQQVNFALAYKTRTIGGFSKWSSPRLLGTTTAWFASNDTASFVEVTPYLIFQLGANVAKVELIADVKDAYIQLQTDQGSSAGTANTGGTGRDLLSEEYTLATPGAVLQARVKIKRYTADAQIFGYTIREVYMVAGDFP